jgi:hypothetical protein
MSERELDLTDPEMQITAVEALAEYRLRLTLSDGRVVERDVRHLVPADGAAATVFTPWRDPAYFGQVQIDPAWHAPVWPNGADLDPEVLIWGLHANGQLRTARREGNNRG